MSRSFIFVLIFLLIFPLLFIAGAPTDVTADTDPNKTVGSKAKIPVDDGISKKSGERNGNLFAAVKTKDGPEIAKKFTTLATPKPGDSTLAVYPKTAFIPSSSVKPTTVVPAPATAPPPFTSTLIVLTTATTAAKLIPKTTTTHKVIPPNVPTSTPHHVENQTTTSINPSSFTTIKPTHNINATAIITKSTTDIPEITENEIKELLQNLKNATELWDEINLNNILQNKGIISNETIDQATEAFYNIFNLGQICSKWLKSQQKVDQKNPDSLFFEIQNATATLVEKIEGMNQEIDNGIQQQKSDPKAIEVLKLKLGRKYVNPIIMYLNNTYQYQAIAYKFSEMCFRNHTHFIKHFAMEELNKALGIFGNQNAPLNDKIFANTANIFVNAMKQYIMINMACDVLVHQKSFNYSVLPFLDQSKNDMNKIFYDIYEFADTMEQRGTTNSTVDRSENTQKLKAFKKYVGSIIDEYLDKYGGESQSAITEKIYSQLTSSSSYAKDYNFAVGVYSQPNATILVEGNNAFSNTKTMKGKNAFVIANQKSPNRGYKACKFWELKESDVCAQTNKDKFKNIIPILKKHCNGISDIGVIKLTPHLLDGYVSVKFDRESNAFSMSGLGHGECFHYSIFVANALA